MTDIGMRDSSEGRTQMVYARLAGFLFLWLIVTGLAGQIIMSHIAGSGNFSEVSKRVSATEHLYRFGLGLELIETLSALVLAFALYATLKPVGKLLAQLGMYWRLAESFLGCVGTVFGFARLHLYSSDSIAALGNDHSEALVGLTRQAGFATSNISAMCFSIGSLIFFYLFYKSRSIPRILSAFGVFASVVVTVICFASLIFPEYAGTFQYGWAPMAIAEVALGFWLLIKGVKLPSRVIHES